jgi:hypothetical protein
MSVSLILQVHDEAADAEELGELVSDLRQTMLGAGIEGCSIGAVPTSGRGMSTMERAVDPAMLDALLLTLAGTNVLKAVTKLISTWASIHNCSVKVNSGNGKTAIVFTGNAEDLQKVAELLPAATGNDVPATSPESSS